MRDLADDAERLTDDDGTPICVREDDPAAAILFVGSTTEPGPGTRPLASEPDFPRLPLAEDGIFIVDAESGTVLETVPWAGERTGRQINGEAAHNTYRPARRGRLPPQERRKMKRKEAQGLGGAYPVSPTAKETFTEMVSALDGPARPRSGWDPYEVWRTRVKGSSSVMQGREPVHLRTAGGMCATPPTSNTLTRRTGDRR
jgi:hypothetical protein